MRPLRGFRYRGNKTREISFPLGGIGTGSVGLSGTGRLLDWEIFNRPAKNNWNGLSHFAVKAEAKGRLVDARVLHGDLPPPFSGSGSSLYDSFGFGPTGSTLAGLPHFRSTEFIGGFPFAEIRFRDPKFPGQVRLQAFNPFIPLNSLDSSLPAAFFTVDIRNPTRHALDYTVAFTIRNPAAGQTVNQLRLANGFPLLHLTGTTDPADTKFGDFAIATDAAETHGQAFWYRGRWVDNLTLFWREFAAPGLMPSRTYQEPGSRDHGTLAARVHVPAGSGTTVRFVFAWHVPNCSNYWNPLPTGACGCAPSETIEATWKNYYATVFADAPAVAVHALKNWDRLERETRLFQETLFRSTLPPSVLDAVSANLSILKTPTCLRLEDGSFYGWEGCHPDSGCCDGSCTHVWNYAYVLPFLFPELERSMRELDYRYNLRPDGGMPFRLQLPLGRSRSNFRPCADGQLGGVLKVYREWKISGDTDWLRRLWPSVKKSIEFAWAPDNPDRWDPDRTGVLHGRQHHTLDMELFGPNAWLTGFYLAALKAGSEIATACGESETAAAYKRMFQRGRRWVGRHLFNGEYFIQRINLHEDGILEPFAQDADIRSVYWSSEHGELKYQVGEGCGIDQLLAQWHADLIGLGDLFDRNQVRRALRAIYRHNFRVSMRNRVNPCRLFCLDDEQGTVLFSWPKGRRKPVLPVPYSEEVWPGCEYQAASHLILHGFVKEGVAMVKAVRSRFDGERRNPWNEFECGSNYARSMSSFALLNAFSGLQVDQVRQQITFRPARKVRGRFRCFWSSGSAWGEIDLQRSQAVLRVYHGRLALRRLILEIGRSAVSAFVGDRPVGCVLNGNTIEFDEMLEIPAGGELRIHASPPSGARGKRRRIAATTGRKSSEKRA